MAAFSFENDNRTRHVSAMFSAIVIMLAGGHAPAEPTIEERTVEAIRAAALAPNEGPAGRPLPLVAHWHRMTMPPEWQIEQIRKGRHMLPWIDYHRDRGSKAADQHAEAIRQLAKWKLPFVLLTGGQWEADFYGEEYNDVPAEQTGVGVSLKGNKIKAVSPLSPIEPWEKLGRKWTDNAMGRRLQELYPDPPLVLFVSNNEAHDVRWHAAEKLKHYVDRYGQGRDDNFKRKVFSDGWIERYGALFKGMRAGLANETWRKNARFAGYNAFGPDHFARWGDWVKYSLHTEDRIAWEPLAWDGGIPESYDNHWEPQKKAYNVWSMQAEMMNLVFMKEEAFKARPGFWHEVIFWDGYLGDKDNNKRKQYEKDGYPCTPAMYRGWTQYVMWTLVPRVAREWRGSALKKENWEEYFDQIVASVELVHAEAKLGRFWRHGKLVPNRSRKHPFNTDVPARWKDVDRWFHLTTNLDPAELKLDAKMPVWTLARVIGQKPNREWLLYAHAPMGARKGVEVEIPEYRKVKIDVPVEGAFYLFWEADGSVGAVGKEK